MNTIDAKTLKQWQADHRSFLLLDVLNADSFAKDHIPGSVNVPLDAPDFAQQVERLAGDKARAIVTYCASMECDASTRAARQLNAAGFTDVTDFKGGLKEWNEEKARGASAA
ncbi:MAG TPA: rhodanese-like domain-containing protein [Planctomycetota bacterium]|nr:rhodanese-like domain-containing protein [Planctomycetota bacterium]